MTLRKIEKMFLIDSSEKMIALDDGTQFCTNNLLF